MHKYVKLGLVSLLVIILVGCGQFKTKPPLNDLNSKSRVSRTLLELFPQRRNTEWIYEGFAEYGHRMKLVRISRIPNRIIHHIDGEVADLSGGESPRNFKFKVRYLFTGNTVSEQIIAADTPFPHTIKNLVLLKLPLKKGNKWQQIIVKDGKRSTLNAEIIKVGWDNLVKQNVLTVRYRVPMAGMPNGVYEEYRKFVKGKGVYSFEKTFGKNPSDIFGYQLREIKIGK
ncbi:MAG TPA: hypothetical protein PLZ08_02020 [Bacillota bacterium]|jgi:hypothetical protein|nr:hypothetical protein [Bacillota bacterium]HOL09043.1 hypothetical protein [Bacillota bacterium]HPO96718.1 hypothetical protein [Bacillota bacterium]